MDKSASQTQKNRIGLMGGTFDPIHHGHLVAAEEARFQFGMEKVIFIPAGQPPHKNGKNITHPYHRLEMTRRAIGSNPHFTVSDIEIKKEGLSYTIDTVRDMRKQYKGWEIFFITGADAVLEILTWKNVEELLQKCYFVAATRPGFRLEALGEKLARLGPEYASRIKTLEVPALAISSTDIRRRVNEGRPIKYLLPEAAENYIYQHGLYKDLTGW